MPSLDSQEGLQTRRIQSFVSHEMTNKDGQGTHSRLKRSLPHTLKIAQKGYPGGERTSRNSLILSGSTLVNKEEKCVTDTGKDITSHWKDAPPDSPADFHFKTIISLGTDVPPQHETLHAFPPEGCRCESEARKGDDYFVRYSVILNIGDEVRDSPRNAGLYTKHDLEVDGHSCIPVSLPDSDVLGCGHHQMSSTNFCPPSLPVSCLYIRPAPPPVPKRSRKTNLSPRREFLESLLNASSHVHDDKRRNRVSLGRKENQNSGYSSSSTLSIPPSFPVSSLYIRPAPPPVPKRSQKTNLSPRGEFLSSVLKNRLVYDDKRRNSISLGRKESQNSGYSSSSALSSAGSPGSSVSSSKMARLDSSLRDSDYFGSSSEEDDFDVDKKRVVLKMMFLKEQNHHEPKDDEEEVEEDPNDLLAPLKPIIGFPGLRKMRRFSSSTPPKEYDLEQRIALEIKMREGTAKLLAACGAKSPQASQPHTLEAAKSLLTSNERMTAYMAELQRRRASRRTNVDGCDPSLARVCVSDLRMPLLWKDIEHFKNKGDNRKFAVFVLLKIGTEIYDTVMVNPVDRSMTDICFDDILVFNGIPANFECSVEVYSYLFENEMLIASIPRKLKKTFHSSISRTVGRKLAVTLRDELASGDLGPKFEMVASAKLTAESISNSISTFDFTCNDSETRPDQLPLFGHFCCRIAAQPDCFTQERISAHATVPESGNRDPSWCRMLGWRIEVWETKEEAETSPHHPLALSLDRTTEISQTSSCIVQLSNTRGIDRGMLTLRFKTIEECKKWLRVLRQHASDHERWGKAAEEEMEILTPQPSRHSFIVPKKGRFTSLYEETPLRDSSPSSEKSSTDDLYNHLSFSNPYSTPAHLPHRTRAFTLSSSRSSFRRWGSVRANMPFFKTKS